MTFEEKDHNHNREINTLAKMGFFLYFFVMLSQQPFFFVLGLTLFLETFCVYEPSNKIEFFSGPSFAQNFEFFLLFAQTPNPDFLSFPSFS